MLVYRSLISESKSKFILVAHDDETFDKYAIRVRFVITADKDTMLDLEFIYWLILGYLTLSPDKTY